MEEGGGGGEETGPSGIQSFVTAWVWRPREGKGFRMTHTWVPGRVGGGTMHKDGAQGGTTPNH